MNESKLRELIEQATDHSERAYEALNSGQPEAAQVEMANLATKYQAYCDGSTEEGPEQQEDDAKDHESPDEKSGVGDASHHGYDPD